MKLSNRAKAALATAGYSCNEQSAIAQLAAFAAQNSGIEWGNYGGDGTAYNQECRSITKDWHRFKKALIEAGQVGVTDDNVIAEAPHAFSGRLEWDGKLTNSDGIAQAPHWDYCTGQYFPTEYRKAAATLMEYAARAVKQARKPRTAHVTCIAELKKLNADNGGCWFEESTMRFFGTKIETDIINGKYFVSSEQPPHAPRNYSVRTFNEEGDIDTVGGFGAHDTKADALDAIEHLSH